MALGGGGGVRAQPVHPPPPAYGPAFEVDNKFIIWHLSKKINFDTMQVEILVIAHAVLRARRRIANAIMSDTRVHYRKSRPFKSQSELAKSICLKTNNMIE